MSSFFTIPSSQRKRKRQDTSSKPPRKNVATARSTEKARNVKDDESISGSDENSDEEGRSRTSPSESESEDQAETAAEQRLKLAERYLENIRNEVAQDQEVGFDAEEIDRELIAARLKEDVAGDKGRVYRHIAAELDMGTAKRFFFRADTSATTAVAVCPPFIYTTSKDMTLIKWEMVFGEEKTHINGNKNLHSPQRRPKQLLFNKGRRKIASTELSHQHHTAPILCVAASKDGKFVVTGGEDKKLIVWDPATLKPLKVFTQHRDAVTELAFRGNTNQLFSASKDRTVKVWSLNELAYIETLFGHQDHVVDVSAVGGSQERCISVGARDRTARLWKVVEESQLVFRGGGGGGGGGSSSRQRDGDQVNGDEEQRPNSYSQGSLDRVTQIDTQLFVTGGDNGALSLFSLNRKKALHTLPLAHGADPPPSRERLTADLNPDQEVNANPTPRWITALACVPFSDLFVTGSWDGCIRLWRLSSDQKKIESAGTLGEVATMTNGADIMSLDGDSQTSTVDQPSQIRGVVNDIEIFERGDRGKDGVTIIAGIATETRLGRWKKVKCRNGALMIEIPKKPLTNGSAKNGHLE